MAYYSVLVILFKVSGLVNFPTNLEMSHYPNPQMPQNSIFHLNDNIACIYKVLKLWLAYSLTDVENILHSNNHS